VRDLRPAVSSGRFTGRPNLCVMSAALRKSASCPSRGTGACKVRGKCRFRLVILLEIAVHARLPGVSNFPRNFRIFVDGSGVPEVLKRNHVFIRSTFSWVQRIFCNGSSKGVQTFGGKTGLLLPRTVLIRECMLRHWTIVLLPTFRAPFSSRILRSPYLPTETGTESQGIVEQTPFPSSVFVS
jgi:hypothetical protein